MTDSNNECDDENDKHFAWTIMVLFHNFSFGSVLLAYIPHFIWVSSYFFDTFFVWTVRITLFGPYFVYWFIVALMVKGSYFDDKIDMLALSITVLYTAVAICTSWI